MSSPKALHTTRPPTTIVAPAIRYQNTECTRNTTELPCLTLVSVKHYDRIMANQLDAVGGDSVLWDYQGQPHQEGFIDQAGNFWGRKEALDLTIQLKQHNPTSTYSMTLLTDTELHRQFDGEYITCAANLYDEVLVCGARHYDLIMHRQLNNVIADPGHLLDGLRYQGFLTSTGRWVDRIQAMAIAKRIGQFNLRNPHKSTDLHSLYSESIY